MIRMASEDIGLADPHALTQAVAALQAVTAVGRPEADLAMLQCAAYLARAPKSNALEVAHARILVWLGCTEMSCWIQLIKEAIKQHPNEPVPIYLRNAPTSLLKSLGYGQDYLYNPDHNYASGKELGQEYLPLVVAGAKFLDFGELRQ
jgi:putative ATPase